MIESLKQPHLIWLYDGSLSNALDAATWLETTNELRKLGWRVTLVGVGSSGLHCINGKEVFCIPRPNLYFIRQLVFHLLFLRSFLRQWKNVDIIVFHQMSAPWLIPIRLMRYLEGKRRPLLAMDIRSLHMPMQSRQGLKGWLRGKFIKLINWGANFWIDGYLTITYRMAEAIPIPPSKLWGVWPSGVNLDQFISVQDSHCWPSPDEPIRLIYIGALNYERNLMTLCHAVERANAAGMIFQLTMVGEGTELESLVNFANRTNARISVLPTVHHNQIPGILAMAHIGVLPFPDEEKFRVSSPIKLFEYMAAGLPILATRIVCHTDVLGNGGYAIWAEDASEQGLFDALLMAWQSRDLLSEMGRLATLAAQGWTWAASAEKLKKALEKGYYSIVPPMEIS